MNPMEDEDCDHEWIWVPNWYGNPGVIHGVQDCSSWLCKKCGEEDFTKAPPKRRRMVDDEEL